MYFISSSVFYIFLIILSLCLIPISVAINHDNQLKGQKMFRHIAFMVFIFFLGAGSLKYLVKRINWLLIDKEDELCYRSLKAGEDVLKTEGKDEEDSSEGAKKYVERRLD